MAEESEQKELPATQKKFREARRKGQVPQSKDLAAGFSIFVVLMYLLYAWPTMSDRLLELVNTIGSRQDDVFADASHFAIHQAIRTLLALLGPVVALTVATVILFSIIATRGPVFSSDPIKPRFEKISPAKGFKRVMSMRNVVEFVKSLIKVVFLSALLAAVLLVWLQSLFEVPGCGAGCVRGTVIGILTPLTVAVGLAFVLIGLFDMPVQSWLFRRDMRMTRTEFKRERKDLEGDPQFRQELRRLRREAVTRSTKRGLHEASLVLYGGSRLVALRYVSDDTPVPIIVAKEEGGEVATLLAQARRQNCPVVEDGELVSRMFAKARVGYDIETDVFPFVAQHLVRLKLV
ncbi:EscU/YscU/HrcU family type III secretion system export apparatus switch protein [Chelativorans salis]|uniref:EscU/YscU/HrcU family type III secretion system export apparatus switch protein n=1 Tax=Chelativorans salis TaxID=2978478 RepID=A0ABT2LQL8_9HYPH|nr:EscU/YscU/HrcU family type III secretion system export apparatus switch protein [Chelativorans sp. EGI FJ00035]MCT7376851.1 EscU/YscU/HrcU family type III secretion system export apparatus switch protein [Chelativorans sp. EGI FJ00035]